MKNNFLFLTMIVLVSCNNAANNGGATNDTTVNEPVVEKKNPEAPAATGCTSFFWFKEGTVAEYSIKDATGKETSHTTSTVTNVKNGNGEMVADFTTSMGGGKAISATYKCDGDKIYMDMKSLFEKNFSALAEKGGMQLEINDAYLSFPSNMKPGDELEGTTIKVIAKKDGKPVMTTINEIKDRKVESIEKISTPAGSWDCLKINETNVTTSEMMGKSLPGKEERTTYWFAPEVGMVKTANYNKDGKLLTETDLVSFTIK